MSIKLTKQTVVAYIPGSITVQTILGENGKGIYFGQSRYQIRKEYPNVTFIPYFDAVMAITEAEEEQLCSNPTPVTEEVWDEALNVLPPGDWRRINGVECFHITEMYTSDISSIYFKVPLANGTVLYYACRNRVDRKGWLVHILLNELNEQRQVGKEVSHEN